MLPPHELKNKTFSKGIRGYVATEVDEYLEFIIEKYTELYKTNLELDKQLSSANARLEQLSNEEEAIRKTLVKAQKMGEGLIEQAQEKADNVIQKIRERSEEIISSTEEKLAAEKESIIEMRASADEFREKVFTMYVDQLKYIKETQLEELEEVVTSIPEDKELKKKLLNVDNAQKDYDITEKEESNDTEQQ